MLEFHHAQLKSQLWNIANYLSNLDTKINQLTQTQTFKKGLLQQMFV